MKLMKSLLGFAFLSATLAFSTIAWAADHSGHQHAKVTAYPLKTCLVTDEKFGGDMGEPYVFTNANRQVKLCCKGCLKDFKKDTAKYMKKLEAAEKAAK